MADTRQGDDEATDEGEELGVLEGLVGRELLGRYRIDALIGLGGTGAVFRGRQLTLKRDVAIKVLHPQLTKNERIFGRFQREAENTARFEHPNIVQVLEAGSTDDGFHFIVMQLLEGTELHQLLGDPMPPRRAAELMLQLFCGLEHAHQRGVVHRDLKPENVFLTLDHEGQETIKLVDFGLAKLVEGAADGATLTRLGMVFGTPGYMSPEQATGLPVDHRTDLYSAGLIFYGLLAGRPPFLEEDAVALMQAQVKQTPPPLPDEVPGELAGLVFELLAKHPGDRPPDATDVRMRLEEAIPRLPVQVNARRPLLPMWTRLAGAAVLTAGLAIGVAMLASGGDTQVDAGLASTAEATPLAEVSTSAGADGTAPISADVEPPRSDDPAPRRGPDPAERPEPAPADPTAEPAPATKAPAPSPSPSPSPKKKSTSKGKTKPKKKTGLFGNFRRPGGD